ncbi:ESCRT-II complex subunit-domain-containing protein [Bombardia bombarda]|uniref:ESCRT-II complex subunit VPS25 n=1 Tax=Bombardia bombarda TaxID=252184 RepID=A0AA40C886_9PEZI|nr:ESCRT-II complex subunit-domain-containing protein [Bombardia bombarda]
MDLTGSCSGDRDPLHLPPRVPLPPFFTRQTNLTTHHAQLTKWASFVLAYCCHYRIFKLSLSGLSPTTTTTSTATSQTTQATTSSAEVSSGAEELFYNRKLNKRLSHADAREVINFLRKDGRAEYVTGSGSTSSEGSDLVWVYWRTPEEWAALIEAWVDETGQRGTVLTLYELTQGDATVGTEFHGLDPEILQKALGTLVKRAKAQIFGSEDSQGVKFF